MSVLDLEKFRITLVADELLLSAVVLRLMQLDRGFTQNARQWFDILLGAFSASEHADEIKPDVLSALRDNYVHLLASVESLAPAPSERPKSIRRRIFEWFERG